MAVARCSFLSIQTAFMFVGGSFAENFYYLRRVPAGNGSGQLGRWRKVMSLVYLVSPHSPS